MNSTPPGRFVDNQWDDLVAQFPSDLDGFAKKNGALKYRRKIHSAANLLRLLFGYSVLDLSLRSLAEWGPGIGACQPITDVALLHQLRNGRPFFEALLGKLIESRTGPARPPAGLRLVDGSGVSAPGSDGLNWWINTVYDPSSGLTVGCSLCPASKGEQFAASNVSAGDVVVGDRHYGRRDVIAAILDREADLVIRAKRTMRLLNSRGVACTPEEFIQSQTLVPGETLDLDVSVRLSAGRVIPVRLILVRKSEEAVAAAVRRLHRSASKKQKPNADSPEALHAAEYMFLLTTLPRALASAAQVATIYRIRWQIELLFKRWKSILHLDHVRAKLELAESYLLGKLMMAVLIEAALKEAASSPWGTRFTRPASAKNVRVPHAASAPPRAAARAP